MKNELKIMKVNVEDLRAGDLVLNSNRKNVFFITDSDYTWIARNKYIMIDYGDGEGKGETRHFIDDLLDRGKYRFVCRMVKGDKK